MMEPNRKTLSKATTPSFKLRVVPWFTDSCITFLSNIFKWLPQHVASPFVVLEFGAGNSTLYFLQKRCKVVTIESDDSYIELITEFSIGLGKKCKRISPEDFTDELLSQNDLIIIRPNNRGETDGILRKYDWSLIVNDGVSRREVLEEIHRNKITTILLLDNIEYCANWGRLDRTSAKPDLIETYRSILRDNYWRHYIFEQGEGRDGRGVADSTGWESPHRWASAVLWPEPHILNQYIISHLGFPIVNELGVANKDLENVGERCPFNWEKMEWRKGPFPPELDLKLARDYE